MNDDRMMIGVVRWSLILAFIIGMTALTLDWRYAFAVIAGAAVSVMLVGFNSLFARHLKPGANAHAVRTKLIAFALLKYPTVVVVIFFTVKAGNAVIACFCGGFGLVYLVLLAAALVSLKTERYRAEER